KEIKKKEEEFLKEKQELDKMNSEWKSQAALLSESARMQKQQEFQEKFMGLRNAELTFQAEIKRKEQKATQKIAIQVQKLVDDMAKKQNLDVVFELNTSGLLFLKDPLDITKDVIAEYQKQGSKTGKVAKKEDGKDEK